MKNIGLSFKKQRNAEILSLKGFRKQRYFFYLFSDDSKLLDELCKKYNLNRSEMLGFLIREKSKNGL